MQVHLQTIIAVYDLQFCWRRKIKGREKKSNSGLGLQICISFFSYEMLTSFADILYAEGGS